MRDRSNKPEAIILHCSDSAWGDKAIIDQWHGMRGWAGCGYHTVVLNGRRHAKTFDVGLVGALERGRDFGREGAHCLMWNRRSIGVCMIGIHDFPEAQLDAAARHCAEVCAIFGFGPDKVLGHCETKSGGILRKTCPNTNMELFRARVSLALEEGVCGE